MQIAFTNEQDQFRTEIRRFCNDVSTEPDVRRLMADDTGFDRAVWRRMATELGLQGLALPEEYGGGGFGQREVGIVMEEMGRALFPSPYLGTVVMAATLLTHLPAAEPAQRYLPGIADGSTVAAVALTDDGPATTALPASDGEHLLRGRKSFVVDGVAADLLLVAVDDGGLFAVPSPADGLTVIDVPTIDRTRRQATVVLDGVRGHRIAAANELAGPLERMRLLATAQLTAEQAGGAQRCLEMAVEYGKQRLQFGRPIGSFQAVKHMCADLFVAVEGAKSLAYHAVACAAEPDDELFAAVAAAKAYCSDVFFQAAAQNIQVHGGIGFTWEHPAHLYYRRAKADELMFGDACRHREELALAAGMGGC